MSCRAIKKDLLAESGSVMVLVVRNSRLFRSDDSLGMCVISCKSIPSGDERKMEHLTLFPFPLSDNKYFKELQTRKQSEAVEFCKQMKALLVPERYL